LVSIYKQNPWAIYLLVGITYPTIYEAVQMYKTGIEYLEDIGNYVDLVYIWGSVAMCFLHAHYTPYAFISKLCTCVIVTLAIRRTFNFLRIFGAFSPIVTMLNQVIWQLRIFMSFYSILILLFALMFAVTGVGNYNIDGKFKDNFYKPEEEGGEPVLDPGTPGIEYVHIGQLFGYILQTLRVSQGDFDLLGKVSFMERTDAYLFWMVWLLTVVLTWIIFLNFIVAEASAVYEDVAEHLDDYIWQQKTDLCAEAESLTPDYMKLESKFPKFIIIRKVET